MTVLLLVSRWSGSLDDLLQVGNAELDEEVALGLGELDGLAEGAGGAGEGAQVEQGEPAQDDVGCDAFFLGSVGFECSRDDG